MKTCPKCKIQINENSKFCPDCGNRIYDALDIDKNFKGKFIFYIIGFIIVFFLWIFQSIFITLAILPFVILSFWFYLVVYKDAKTVGLNENWWIAVWFLGPVGAIWYHIVREKRIYSVV